MATKEELIRQLRQRTGVFVPPPSLQKPSPPQPGEPGFIGPLPKPPPEEKLEPTPSKAELIRQLRQRTGVFVPPPSLQKPSPPQPGEPGFIGPLPKPPPEELEPKPTPVEFLITHADPSESTKLKTSIEEVSRLPITTESFERKKKAEETFQQETLLAQQSLSQAERRQFRERFVKDGQITDTQAALQFLLTQAEPSNISRLQSTIEQLEASPLEPSPESVGRLEIQQQKAIEIAYQSLTPAEKKEFAETFPELITFVKSPEQIAFEAEREAIRSRITGKGEPAFIPLSLFLGPVVGPIAIALGGKPTLTPSQLTEGIRFVSGTLIKPGALFATIGEIVAGEEVEKGERILDIFTQQHLEFQKKDIIELTKMGLTPGGYGFPFILGAGIAIPFGALGAVAPRVAKIGTGIFVGVAAVTIAPAIIEPAISGDIKKLVTTGVGLGFTIPAFAIGFRAGIPTGKALVPKRLTPFFISPTLAKIVPKITTDFQRFIETSPKQASVGFGKRFGIFTSKLQQTTAIRRLTGVLSGELVVRKPLPLVSREITPPIREGPITITGTVKVFRGRILGLGKREFVPKAVAERFPLGTRFEITQQFLRGERVQIAESLAVQFKRGILRPKITVTQLGLREVEPLITKHFLESFVKGPITKTGFIRSLAERQTAQFLKIEPSEALLTGFLKPSDIELIRLTLLSGKVKPIKFLKLPPVIKPSPTVFLPKPTELFTFKLIKKPVTFRSFQEFIDSKGAISTLVRPELAQVAGKPFISPKLAITRGLAFGLQPSLLFPTIAITPIVLGTLVSGIQMQPEIIKPALIKEVITRPISITAREPQVIQLKEQVQFQAQARVQVQLQAQVQLQEQLQEQVQLQPQLQQQAQVQAQLQQQALITIQEFDKVLGPIIPKPKARVSVLGIPRPIFVFAPPTDRRRKIVIEDERQAFKAQIRERRFFKGKEVGEGPFITVSKVPLTEFDALSLVGTIADNSAARTIRIVKTTGKPKQPTIKVTPWNFIQGKFVKKGDRYIEQSFAAIDTRGEIEGISALGWIAERRKVAKIIRPKKIRVKREEIIGFEMPDFADFDKLFRRFNFGF